MFNYFQGSIGALLLHLATSASTFDNGRVLGCSSILYGAFARPSIFNVPTVAGIAASAFVAKLFFPQYLPDYSTIVPLAGSTLATISISGLLTGVGTKLGSGCTSGHMLCGLARRSVRSLVATMVFTSVAVLTAYTFSTSPDCGAVPCYTVSSPSSDEIKLLLGIVAVMVAIRALLRLLPKTKPAQFLVSSYSGFAFGSGLLISGMASPGTTLGFLAVAGRKFNPTLAMVILFGIVPNAIEYWYRKENNTTATPTCVPKFELPTRTDVDTRLVVGSAIFGVGWGLSGICPGPGMLSVVLNDFHGIAFLASFLLGYGTATQFL